MEAVQVTVSLGHALRKEHKLKVRQPLHAAHLASSDEQNPLLFRRSETFDRRRAQRQASDIQHQRKRVCQFESKAQFPRLREKSGQVDAGGQKRPSNI